VAKNLIGKKNFAKANNSFEISGVYLFNIDGNVISNIDSPVHSNKDAEVFSSMLTAIKMFIIDSSHPYGSLKDIEYGSFKILVEEGKEFFLVVMGKGDYTKPFRKDMKRVVEGINDKFGEALSNFNGDIDEFHGIDKELYKLTNSFKSQ
jgi:hypothetical protein